MDAEADKGDGRDESAAGGTDDDLSILEGGTFVAFDCMSPLAVASLFVKDEIAQPAHPAVSFCGVPIRRTGPLAYEVVGGGKAVSGSEFPHFRMRWR